MNFQKEFQTAFDYYQAGKLKEAERICRRIQKEYPQNVEILYFLAVIYSQSKQYELAIKFIKRPYKKTLRVEDGVIHSD